MLKFNKMGLVPMSKAEMQEIDGGLFPLLVAGACLLLYSCVQNNNQPNNHGTVINNQTNGQNVGDSISNSNHGHLHVSPGKKR